MRNKIQWLKWVDPLRWQDTKDPELSGEQSTTDSFSEDDNDGDQSRHVRMIAGPYGLVPVGEHGLSSKLYKLWVAHTNFDITESVVESVEQIPGVEILRVWTRYRMWIGIGNLFDTTEVQKAIDYALCGEPEPPPPKPISKKQDAAINILVKRMQKEHKNEAWAICRLPDGTLWAGTGADSETVIQTIADQGLDGSIVASSWEKSGRA
jgi:hypothetical protein